MKFINDQVIPSFLIYTIYLTVGVITVYGVFYWFRKRRLRRDSLKKMANMTVHSISVSNKPIEDELDKGNLVTIDDPRDRFITFHSYEKSDR